MKFIKNLDIKNNKVLLGLFALLFVGSIAQTHAILKTRSELNNGQSAQVISAGSLSPNSPSSSSNCLRVSPISSVTETLFTNPEIKNYIYYMNWSVKNICKFAINVVNPYVYHQGEGGILTSLINTEVQVIDSVNNPININVANNTYGIQGVTEAFLCISCESGAVTNHSYPEGFFEQIPTFNFDSEQTRNIKIFVNLSVPDNTSAFIRTRLKSLFYFRSSTALADNIIQNSEIVTASFPNSFSNPTATSYFRANRPTYMDGLMGEGTRDEIAKPEFNTQTMIKTQ